MVSGFWWIQFNQACGEERVKVFTLFVLFALGYILGKKERRGEEP
jgi:hypothetical protein